MSTSLENSGCSVRVFSGQISIEMWAFSHQKRFWRPETRSSSPLVSKFNSTFQTFCKVVQILIRPTCRPEHAAVLVTSSHPHSILVKKLYEHSNPPHALGIILILGIVHSAHCQSIPATYADWIAIPSARRPLSGSQAADPLAGDRFLCLLFASEAMSTVQPSNGSFNFTGCISNKSIRK